MKIVERIDGRRMMLTGILVILFVTAFSSTVFALTTTSVNAGLLAEGLHEISVPIMNDADAKNITFSITPRSRYLENYVAIEPVHLSLQPHETKYVKVKINVTALAPGEHELILLPNIHTTQAPGVSVASTSTITIKFSKSGIVTKNVVLNSLDVYKNGKIEFRLYAENKGNARVTALPFVEIRKYGNHLTMLKGSTQHLLEPSQIMQMDINYNAASGTYQAIAYVKFDGIDSNTVTRYFTVGDANQTQSDSFGTGGTGFGNTDETFYWYDENATIDIGVEQEKDGKDGKTIGKIKIIDFNAIVGDKLLIKLKIENATEPFVYDVLFSLIDENGIVIKSITDTGRLDGVIEISKEIEISGILPGNYTLKLEIKYRQNGMKTIEKSLQINIPEKRDSITGLVISEQGYGLYIILAIIAIVAVFLVKSRFMKKHESRINYHKPYRINQNINQRQYEPRRYVKIRDRK